MPLVGQPRGGFAVLLCPTPNVSVRLAQVAGTYQFRTLRIQACNAQGVVGGNTGTMTYGRTGSGPAFGVAVPTGFVPVELSTGPAGSGAGYIDLFDIWVSATVAGEGVSWDAQT